MNRLSALEYLKKFFYEIVKGRKDYKNLLLVIIELGLTNINNYIQFLFFNRKPLKSDFSYSQNWTLTLNTNNIMKILIVSTIPTHPTNAGNRNWILSQATLLKELGHDIHFLYIYEAAFRKKNNDYKSLVETMDFWGEKGHLFTVPIWEKLRLSIIDHLRESFFNWYWLCDDAYPHGLHKIINKLDKYFTFDAIIINYYYLSKCFNYINIPLKAISTHDCFSYRDLSIQAKSIYTTTPNEEAKALQRCPHIFALQDEENIFFQKLSPNSKVYSVYNTYKFHDLPITNTRHLLFFSGLNEYNINGLKWFLDNIYPTLINKFPNIKLLIGGGICTGLQNIKYNNIKLLGYFNDPIDFYKLGDIVINPTYQGTGLKIKTFEGIAFGKAIMAHPHSIIGIYNPSEAPIFYSTKASEWAAHLEKLWSKDTLQQIKNQSNSYIQSLNQFVITQYKKFLNQK